MDKAVWIIAHGSNYGEWVEILDQTIGKVNSSIPIITSFFEEVEERSIEQGIKELELLKINKVIVIPLFVSSGSKHIKEIKGILSLYEDNFEFIYTSCMDDHPYVVQHIIDTAKELSIAPDNETLLLIAHGSRDNENLQKWLLMLNNIIGDLKGKTGYKEISYATFLPNTISSQLEELENNNVIVIPLFLSNGVFTDIKIPREIKGYNVQYNGLTYLNGDWIHKWIESQIKEFLSYDS